MTIANRTLGVLLGCVLMVGASSVRAQDWPQWLGPNRDGKATGFTAPSAWPKELTQKWKITVGEGVATPALVGDKLYVFSRQDGSEIVRCLESATGKELWKDSYETGGATGIARDFSGPRCSPAVADGKVVTLGIRGILSCYDAASGKKLWRNEDFKGSYPRFMTSSSPIIVDGLCIAQMGGEQSGTIAAYELATGKEKWQYKGDGTAYASPVLLAQGGAKVLVAETMKSIIGVSVADGKLLWETPFRISGRGYNASTPMVAGQTVIFSGTSRGTKAVKIEKKDDATFAPKELWSNSENSVQYNTPIVKNGLVFGLTSGNKLFCIDADGKTAWTSSIPGRGGYGTIVDAGSVLFALTPKAELKVYEPSDKEYKQLGSYKVADDETYAYPVVAGNRVFVKDRNSLTLWTIE
jgi:outer membrane protein assembly factor BamB